MNDDMPTVEDERRRYRGTYVSNICQRVFPFWELRRPDVDVTGRQHHSGQLLFPVFNIRLS